MRGTSSVRCFKSVEAGDIQRLNNMRGVRRQVHRRDIVFSAQLSVSFTGVRDVAIHYEQDGFVSLQKARTIRNQHISDPLGKGSLHGM